MRDIFFVIGCGSIGQRHIRNLRAIGVTNIMAFDTEAQRLDEAVRNFDVVPSLGVEHGLQRNPEAVLICTPPNLHLPLAQLAITAGCHVFVEKPLADKLDGVDDLLVKANLQSRVVYVGYNLRFHAGLVRIKEMLDENLIGRPLSVRAEFGQYLPNWRPKRDYRLTYTANASMGGGIILDGSHELDYIRWLFGEVGSVYCVSGNLSNLEMDVEDTAEITIKLEGNIFAQVHLDCIQRAYSRNCKIIGEKGTLFWDSQTGVRHYSADMDSWHEEFITPDPNEMYVEEIRHFLACIRGEDRPKVDGETGKRVLEIALAAARSASLGREEVL